jgi:two-component system, LytTR family, response regulator
MNNISCIIVDDEQDAIELLMSRVGLLFKNITVTGTYSHWEKAFEALRSQKCDLLFMDISMPGKNGIELLKIIPGLECEIIFVTAHDSYALDAFSFSTSGYILKPIDDAALSSAINKAAERIHNKRIAKQPASPAPFVNDRIGIPNNHGIDYVNISDILYLESTNKCTKIVTTGKEYLSSLNLGKFQHLVDGHSFFQVHRSYIINLGKILRYESSGLIIMSNKDEIPLARSIKSEFLKILDSNY